jgi:RNA polymerase sigma-70 factor (ECF subfamily)
MDHADKGSTCPALLGRGGDWTDHDAWVALFERYDDLIRHCCDRHGLNGADADEVRQETWIEVARRLQRFRYDPRGSFRAWLWIVCRNKAISFLRSNNRRRAACLDDRPAVAPADPDSFADDDRPSPLFTEAARIQAAVRAVVEPRSWEAFWLSDVYDWKIERVAIHLGSSQASVYKAVQRIRARLKAEGAKQSASLVTAR